MFDFSKVKAFVDEKIIKEKGMPSFDLMVMKGNELLYRHMAGYFDYEKEVPIHENALYYMYSCTKPLTVSVALRLYEEGKLDLEEKVETYLPEYKNIYFRARTCVV